MIKFQLLHNYASEPTRATPGSAGFDFRACDPVTIWPGERKKIPTGVAVQIPDTHAGFFWPRSGLAIKQGLDLLGGLIDADYRGELQILAINHGDRPISIQRGDRVGQLVVSPIEVMAAVVDNLDETVRGDGGMGSTGR